ncbi:nucleoside diphosphate hydrolase [Theileria equi strain WA]|uniref:Nucleoside diphosphate hydrolase n=1 Tax=Theileria equi strain WA TaxID=1537102 RepID=L1LDB0_THEEQ|nr:nucleoside diphosphate hydrolase [Theileria equi strain WA]EKX73163.1 nucleoside diphosphate hydrolase [Theileria equi strain WA]|eukprot:XP_004832615.1 nucleoside diphosphate hydrolase [Theileria equi strain WA]
MIDKTKIESMPNSTEVICMVDKDNNEIGSCTRKEMRMYNEWHRTSATVVITGPEDPHLFYHIRDMSKEYCPGYLDISFGGVVTVGESYLDNAMREVHEECGLCLSEENLIEIGSFSVDGEFIRCHYKLYVALFNGTAEDLIPQKGEIMYIKKASLPELEELLKENKHTESCHKILESLKVFIASGKISQLQEAKVAK